MKPDGSIKLTQVEDDAECSWCKKAKEVLHVTFDDGTSTVLCWADLKRMCRLKLPTKKTPDLYEEAG